MLLAMEPVWDWPEYLPEFEWEAERAGFSCEQLAQTSAGPLLAWSRAGDGPRIYLSAGMHGDEPAGPLALMQLMREGFFTTGASWAVCPALNPTGLASGLRDNADGLDLNRDYLSRQSLEVASHASWLDASPVPVLFVSLHEDWEARGFYLYEINLGVDVPDRARRIIAAAGPWFPAESGPEIDGHTPREAGWIYHEAKPDLPEGWPEAIHLAKIGCPLSFTLETPSHAPLAARVRALAAAVRAACAEVC